MNLPHHNTIILFPPHRVLATTLDPTISKPTTSSSIKIKMSSSPIPEEEQGVFANFSGVVGSVLSPEALAAEMVRLPT